MYVYARTKVTQTLLSERFAHIVPTTYLPTTLSLLDFLLWMSFSTLGIFLAGDSRHYLDFPPSSCLSPAL